MLVSCGDCGEVEALMVPQMYYASASYGGNNGEIYLIVNLDYPQRVIVKLMLVPKHLIKYHILTCVILRPGNCVPKSAKIYRNLFSQQTV